MKISHTAEDLSKRAGDLVLGHLAGHDNGKQVIRCILHHLIPMTTFLDDIQRLDNVAVMKGGSDAKFRCYFLGIFLQGLPRMTIPELLHSKGDTVSIPFQ